MFAANDALTDQYYTIGSYATKQQTYSTGQSSPRSKGAYGSLFVVPELPPSHEASRALSASKLESRLNSYLQVGEDWDGYGGSPASKQSLADAKSFLSKLPNQISLPRPMLAGDGEISLYWEHSGMYAEASFPGDGTYHFIFDSQGNSLCFDELDPNEIYIGQNLMEAIGSIYC